MTDSKSSPSIRSEILSPKTLWLGAILSAAQPAFAIR
jgi:hypothetical protein